MLNFKDGLLVFFFLNVPAEFILDGSESLRASETIPILHIFFSVTFDLRGLYMFIVTAPYVCKLKDTLYNLRSWCL